MKYFFSIVLATFIFINLGTIEVAHAQTTSSSSGTGTDPIISLPARAEDVSDAQLHDIIQKAQASGISDDQIRKAALAKGMSESDVNKLQTRINIIRTAKDTNSSDTSTNRKQNNSGKNDTGARTKNSAPINKDDGPVVFGSDLFSGDNLTFEPNLRIATPKNYILGPDDEVIINVYGNSQVDWKPKVTPDGNIQIPGIGLINVSGKSIEQASGLITSRLVANGYAIGRGTNVSVTLGNIRSIKVTLVGEIVKPGTYTISSLSTLFNALSVSGGPTGNGSLRRIEVIRDNMVIKKLDVYDFILKGSEKDNIRLQEGDIIRVPTYQVHVTLTGQVKHPAIFEVLPGETLNNVITFAGGFTDMAYTASIKAIQLTDQDRKVVDIKKADFNNYIPLRGDYYTVERILNTFENRVSIFGAVFRPGNFELENGLTLAQLIKKASGLKPDAFASRGFISRLKPDNTTELVSFDVRGVVNGSAADIALKKEDVVTIPSLFDLRDEYTITINGEVRNAGQFSYSENMSVEDLVVNAGGFTEAASPKRIEVARRINYSDPNKKNSPVAEISIIDVSENFKVDGKAFKLQPFDVVSVYSSPGYVKQKTVRIEGEVLYAGPHVISTQDERISDLIKRAGGLTISADIESATLKRTNTLGIDINKAKIDSVALEKDRQQRIKRVKRSLRDSTEDTNNGDEAIKNDLVGIDLKKILNNPGSKIDLILEEGDVLLIPKQQQLVKVDGEVLFPSSVVYDSSKSLGDFVDNAGGFSPQALKRRAYVVYANGSVKATHSFLFIKSYPPIKPGSQIIIPTKPVNKGITLADVGAIIGTLSSAAAILIGVISITRH